MYANIGTIAELVQAKNGSRATHRVLRSRECAYFGRKGARIVLDTLVLEWTDPPMSGGHWPPRLVEIARGVPALCNSAQTNDAVTRQSFGAPADLYIRRAMEELNSERRYPTKI